MKLVKKKFDDKPSRVDKLKKKFDNDFSDILKKKDESDSPKMDITGKTTPCMISKNNAVSHTNTCQLSKSKPKGKTTAHCVFKSGRTTPDVLESDCVNIYIYADDQSSRGPDAGTALNSKQIDDKFKEIMQKRKGNVYCMNHLTFFPPLATIVVCFLSCSCTSIADIANSMNSDQTAPLVHSVCFHGKIFLECL